MLITLANILDLDQAQHLDPDQAQHNVGPDLDPNCPSDGIYERFFLCVKNSADDKKV